MSLRAKLKQKEAIEEENSRLKEEVQELRAKAAENERKKVISKEEIQNLQGQISGLSKDNRSLKDEILELKSSGGPKGKKTAVSTTKHKK